MVEYKGGYDWADIYEERYHELQKQNNELACRLGTAQSRQDELIAKLDHIEGNRLWKMTSPARKAISLILNSDGRRNEKIAKAFSSSAKGGKDRSAQDEQEIIHGEDVQENDFQRAYHAEAYKQKNPYITWIEENEKTVSTSIPCSISSQFAVLYTEDCGTAKTQLTADLLIGRKYLMFVSKYGRLADGALCSIEEKMRSGRYRMLYGDEDYYIKGTQRRLCPWFKPDWSPDTLLSFMYFGSVVVFTTECVNKLAWYGSSEGFENLYYLCLQAGLKDLADSDNDSCANSVAHIDKVLFHREYGSGKSYEEDAVSLDELLKSGELRRGAEERYSKMKKNVLALYGIKADIRPFGEPGICSADLSLSELGDEPKVSIIILSKDHPDVLKACLDSIVRKTDYGNYEIIVVDNGSSDDNQAAVETLRNEYPFAYIYDKREFNFSLMCNEGVSHSSGKLIFLMNDDVEVIEKDWMRLMAGQAMRPHVGAVGAKLYYAGTDRMQHIGVTNLTAGPAHKLTTYPDTHDYYYGRNSLNYDMIGVTGAALMVRRDIYDLVGGLDTEFPVAYNDVDFCMSIYEKGYYNVQRNDVEFFHHESLSRGNDDKNDSKLLRLVDDMDRLYTKHPELKGWDPFYNKNLTGHISDYICDVSPAYDDSRKKNAPAEKINAGNYAKTNRSDILKFTVDHIRHRGMTCLNEAVILIADGWSYLPGEDNSRFDKWILLSGSKGSMYRVKPDLWYRKDVIDILPDEQNVDLAGFILRVAEADLDHDDYRIGMMCRDTDSGREITAWSDSILKVPHESDREE